MRRCNCLKYKELQLQKKDSRAWIFSDEDGLVPLECVYPLADFDCGKVIPLCPYYLYIKDNIRISRAFFKRKSLSNEDVELIEDAVENCPNRVKLLEKFIEERHAIILYIYANKYDMPVDRRLFDKFYDFIQNRQRYLDISPCLGIAPRYHDERMQCIDQSWIEAFEKYIKERT